jgi:hypothetical protein
MTVTSIASCRSDPRLHSRSLARTQSASEVLFDTLHSFVVVLSAVQLLMYSRARALTPRASCIRLTLPGRCARQIA